MKELILLSFFSLAGLKLHSQDFQYKKLAETISVLRSGDSSKIEKIWKALSTESQIPLIVKDSVYFFYRGSATAVEWMGDFNGWGYQKDFPNKGTNIPSTNMWYLKSSFPEDARLDYKILLNGSTWILDPENKYQQWSGVGGGSPNSELRMPAWREDPSTIVRSGVPNGMVMRDLLINSDALGYQLTYSVYLPHHADKLGKLPILYVTDGYEYLHPQLGNMTTVLDNLIFDKKIKPIIVVFVDNREPVNRANNRRMNELAMNAKYLDFFVQELIPHIEQTNHAISHAQSRAIMGTSMGGLTATYFAFAKPDVFGLAGIQSPAFYSRPQIYTLCSNPADPKMKISMTSGLINDTSLDSRKMKDLLEASSCEYHYREVNEGHSWGNWRRLIDDVLIDLFPPRN